MAREAAIADLMGATEALLFVSDEPVSCAKLADILQISPTKMDEVLTALAAEYEEDNRGMQLREVAGGWRFYSHPAYHDLIETYIISWDTRKLSQAALEALAIIAYHQPVNRAGVNAIRGVNSEGVISSLVEKGLVRELGREKGPGNAILYGTTRTFLERFGLNSVKDLPPLEDFAPDEASKEFIRDRLTSVRQQTSGQLGLDDELEEEIELKMSVVQEDGKVVVEEVDRGEDKRVDDPEAMAAIIGEAMTEKVDDLQIPTDDEDDEDEDILEIG